MIEPRIRRASATPEELVARQSKSALPTRSTEDDDEIPGVGRYPGRLPSSARRYNVPATPREYLIPLANGKVLYVTEQKLASLGRDYQAAAREVPSGTIAQKQQRQPRPNQNKAQPPDVMYAPPAHPPSQADSPPPLGERVKGLFTRAFVVMGIGLLMMPLGWIALSALGSWWTTQQNDWQYGRPRTFQIDDNVGHGTAQNPMSHFIALNLNKHIEVIEIPGNDPSQSHIYIGPQLYGPGQDLTPVTLTFADVNADGKVDMIIHVQDSTFLFFNTGTGFKAAPNQQ